VGFIQAGTGAVTRTAQAKMRDVVSVKDFGAVGDGVTDDATAINAALTSVQSTGGVVEFGPGTFVVGSTIQIPDNCAIQGQGQRGATTIKLKSSANVNIVEAKSGTGGNGIGIYDLTFDGNQDNNTQGGVYLLGVTNLRGPAFTVQRVRVTNTRNCVMATGVKTCFFVGGNVWSSLRDIEVYRNDFAQISMWVQASDGIFDGVYLGTNGYSFGSSGVRGLFITGAGNFFTNCYFGGTQPGPQVWLEGASAISNKFTGCIFDNAGSDGLRLTNGASYNQFTACQIGTSTYSEGGTYYAVDNSVTGGRNAWIGCRFYSLYATAYATAGYYEGPGVNGQSQLIGCEFDGTWTTSAVSVPTTSTTQFVGNLGYDTTNVGTLKASTKVNVEGPYPSSAPSTSSVPLGRFNGGGAVSLWASTYAYTSAWLQAIQDDGSNNVKTININPIGGDVSVGASGFTFRPNTDNAQTLGEAGNRWSVVYAGTGTINTSDEREKQDITVIDAAEKRVAVALKALVKKFRFKDAVAAKGGSARIHVGVIAQEVMAAFQAENLDPMRYAIVCYDEWDAELDGDGNEMRPAGNRYGVRYEELLAFIIAAL
jgi:hypothetical protein